MEFTVKASLKNQQGNSVEAGLGDSEIKGNSGAKAYSDYETLGDIANTLRIMKNQGMTKNSIRYVLDRIYWEEKK